MPLAATIYLSESWLQPHAKRILAAAAIKVSPHSPIGPAPSNRSPRKIERPPLSGKKFGASSADVAPIPTSGKRFAAFLSHHKQVGVLIFVAVAIPTNRSLSMNRLVRWRLVPW